MSKITAAALIFILSGLLMPDFVSIKENRILPGTTENLITAAGTYKFAVIAAVSALAAFFSGRNRLYGGIFGFVFITASLYLLTDIVAVRADEAVKANDIARTAFSVGYWIILAGLYISTVNSFKTVHEHSNVGAYALLAAVFVPVAYIFASGSADNISIMIELSGRREQFVQETVKHIMIAGGSVGLAILVGIPAGIAAHRSERAGERIFDVLNILQTIPSLAMFGFLIVPLSYLSNKSEFLQNIGFTGIGWAPAIIALFLYSMLPIVRNMYAGLAGLDKGVIDAAKGVGMKKSQIMLRVELPLSLPVLLNGIRVALVQCIGNTAVAALIGAGGLGMFIFQGLGQSATDLILLGALMTIFLAVVADFIMQIIIRLTAPKGV